MVKFIINFIKKRKDLLCILTNNSKYYRYQIEKYKYHHISFSQQGEDILLSRMFSDKNNGFYVDIGAHHPTRFSNTYYFYLKGWNGINIDANPGSMDEFNRIRPRNVNLEIAISDTEEKLKFYRMSDRALNSFSEQHIEHIISNSTYKNVSQEYLYTKKLRSILDEYLSDNQKIDFLNIDVEGFDFKVLRSNDWNKYRPSIILIEDRENNNFSNIVNSEIYNYLVLKDYSLSSKCFNTYIYLENNLRI